MKTESTDDLLVRFRTGDGAARDRIVERALPALIRWSHGRLPRWARGASDTGDLVQDVIARALPRLRTFQPEGPGALLAFLKRAVRNQVVDEIRRAQRRPTAGEVPESYVDPAPSPFEQMIKAQGLEKFRAALAMLSPIDRALITERTERGCTYDELAATLGKPSGAAARVAVSRALVRLIAQFERQARARGVLSNSEPSSR
jgi:RNA polymerase sigma factor (sigma-70 family)